jgi:hypothetical protein
VLQFDSLETAVKCQELKFEQNKGKLENVLDHFRTIKSLVDTHGDSIRLIQRENENKDKGIFERLLKDISDLSHEIEALKEKSDSLSQPLCGYIRPEISYEAELTRSHEMGHVLPIGRKGELTYDVP